MDRLAFAGAGVIGMLLAGAVVWYAPEPGASAHVAPGPSASAVSVPSASPEQPAPAPALAGLDAGPEPARLELGDAGALEAMPSLELPSSTSRSVRFGVILVAHAAAQGAAAGSRTKADAQALAARLAEQAKSDFKGAVAAGDSGSMEDAGRMTRGVLEPEAEMTLFSLEPGAVSAPIDTPRGFWIVKRID